MEADANPCLGLLNWLYNYSNELLEFFCRITIGIEQIPHPSSYGLPAMPVKRLARFASPVE